MLGYANFAMILSANRSLLNKKFSRPMAKHRAARAKAQEEEDAAPLLSGTGFSNTKITDHPQERPSLFQKPLKKRPKQVLEWLPAPPQACIRLLLRWAGQLT